MHTTYSVPTAPALQKYSAYVTTSWLRNERVWNLLSTLSLRNQTEDLVAIDADATITPKIFSLIASLFYTLDIFS